MSWLGKVLGGAFGFMMGGPLGAALGAALGHQLDQNGVSGLAFEPDGFDAGETQRLQLAFFTATFQIMGHIAKSDGRVSEAEIAAARSIMSRMMLTEDLRRHAVNLFNEGKREDFSLEAAAERLQSECGGRPHLARMFITLQTEAALADGRLRPVEESLLLRLCDRLHFSRYEYVGIRTRLETERRLSGFGGRARPDPFQGRRHDWRGHEPPLSRQGMLAEAYATLGLKPGATDGEVKSAYRRRVSQNHPDKLAGRQATPQRIQQATEQTQKIQKAYDAICKARNL